MLLCAFRLLLSPVQSVKYCIWGVSATFKWVFHLNCINSLYLLSVLSWLILCVVVSLQVIFVYCTAKEVSEVCPSSSPSPSNPNHQLSSLQKHHNIDIEVYIKIFWYLILSISPSPTLYISRLYFYPTSNLRLLCFSDASLGSTQREEPKPAGARSSARGQGESSSRSQSLCVHYSEEQHRLWVEVCIG